MDPLGAALVRSLIGEWKQSGCTVLLNSHHLDEVEKTCDRVAFIKKGKIVAIRELGQHALTAEHFMRFRWSGSAASDETVPDPDALRDHVIPSAQSVLQTFSTKYGAELREISEHQALVTLPDKSHSTAMIKELLSADISLQEAVIERQSLEDIFVQIQRGEMEV
jgi:ABC-type multidrug transport system ATPase subunit